jgi:hypothetical protein
MEVPAFGNRTGATARRSELADTELPLAVLLGLNGLRVSEACGANVEDAAYRPTASISFPVGGGDRPSAAVTAPTVVRGDSQFAPLSADTAIGF